MLYLAGGATKGESVRARDAWADYLALGPDRSLEKLLVRYRTATESSPTKRIKTLKDWSRQFGWQARLAALADAAAKEAEERDLAYRREILEEGYGLKHERVKALKDLAGILAEELQDPTRRWVQDRKLLGQTIVDIERFNASEVEQFRGLLDDIAKEKSERKVVTEVTGKDGGDIHVTNGLSDVERLRRLTALFDLVRNRAVEG